MHAEIQAYAAILDNKSDFDCPCSSLHYRIESSITVLLKVGRTRTEMSQRFV